MTLWGPVPFGPEVPLLSDSLLKHRRLVRCMCSRHWVAGDHVPCPIHADLQLQPMAGNLPWKTHSSLSFLTQVLC